MHLGRLFLLLSLSLLLLLHYFIRILFIRLIRYPVDTKRRYIMHSNGGEQVGRRRVL